ncbi:MAG: LCP family protein [Acidimicrobiia bacterium]
MPRPPRRFARAVAIGAVTSLAVAGSGAFWAWDALGDVRRIDLADSLDDIANRGPENYLVVGSDSRAGADPNSPDYGSMGDEGDVGGKRSDTIMILRLDPGAGTATLLSLPRDLYVTIAGSKTKRRINSAYSKGPDTLIATVKENFAIPINHYIEIDFQGFKSMVDALGGVGVWFDTPVRDKNTGLVISQPGCATLNGVQALAYARSRHLQWNDGKKWRTDGTGDLGRISRQQDFIRRAMKRAVEQVSGNPLGVAPMVDAATGNVTVDNNLSNGDLLSLARRFASIGASGLTTYTFPASPKTVSGAAVLIPDTAAAAPILSLFTSSSTALGTAVPATAAPAAGPGKAFPIPAQDDPAPDDNSDLVPVTGSDPIGVVGDPSKPC